MRRLAQVASLLTALAPATAVSQTAVSTTAASGPATPTSPGGSISSYTADFRNGVSAITPGGVKAAFTWSNQQYPGGTTYNSSGNPAFFGRDSRAAASNLWTSLNTMGGSGTLTSSMFTSPRDAAPGTGVDVSTTYGLIVTGDTTPLRTLVTPERDPQGRFHIADLHIAFDRPLAYPILHFHGIGGNIWYGGSASSGKSASMEFDFTPNAEASSITRLSGNSAFNVIGQQIRNDAPVTSHNPPVGMGTSCLGGTFGYAACGSALVNGQAVTSITLRAYLRSSDAWPWRQAYLESMSPAGFIADALTLGLSGESAEMTPSFSNLPAQIANGVSYGGLTLTCRNQGPDRAYNAACAPSANVGAISNLVCTPPPPATLGALAPNDAISCTFDYQRAGGSGSVLFTGQTGASNDRDGGLSPTEGNNQVVRAVQEAPSSASPVDALSCPYGAPRQIIRNGSFAGWASNAWPNWTRTGAAWGDNAAGARASSDTAVGTLTQTGLTGLRQGPGAHGAAVLFADVTWNNGVPTSTSRSAILTVMIGGVSYGRVITPAGGATLANTQALGGMIAPVTLTEHQKTQIQIHLPPNVAASGNLAFDFYPGGAAGVAPTTSDDFTITNVALYICEGGDLSLSPNHEAAVQPGQLAIYPHELLVTQGLDGATLRFETISEQGLSWVLYKDDGDGVFNVAQDVRWSQNTTIAAGAHRFWMVAQIPSNAPAGWRDATTLRALATLGALSGADEAFDVTYVGGGLEGQVHARKRVALDADCDGVADLGEVGFVMESPIGASQCAIYRIGFANDGVEPITNIRVLDHTPDWMTHIGGSARELPPLPGALPAPAIEQPTDGARGPVAFRFNGALPPGAQGIVEFRVRLMGPPPPSTPKPN